MKPLTRREAVIGAERIYNALANHLGSAKLIIDQMESDLGERTVENTYLYDDIRRVTVGIDLLKDAINELLKSSETIR